MTPGPGGEWTEVPKWRQDEAAREKDRAKQEAQYREWTLSNLRNVCTKFLEARGGRVRHAAWWKLIAFYRKGLRDELTETLVRKTSRYYALRKEDPDDRTGS